MKTCKGCWRNLPLNSFGFSKRTKDGREGKCRACRQDARRKYSKQCEICGKKFKTAKRDVRLCSQKCVGLLRTSKHTVSKSCASCGKSIVVNKFALRDNNYCSRECYWEAVPKHTKGERSPRLEVSCDNCGRTLVRTKSRLKGITNNYCNTKCFSEGIGKHRRDPNLSDEDRIRMRSYPEYEAWRESVLEIRGRECGACFKGEEHAQLHVHHIRNFSTYRELRTEITNGFVLCRECHIEFHKTYGSDLNNESQLEEFIYLKSSFC